MQTRSRSRIAASALALLLVGSGLTACTGGSAASGGVTGGSSAASSSTSTGASPDAQGGPSTSATQSTPPPASGSYSVPTARDPEAPESVPLVPQPATVTYNAAESFTLDRDAMIVAPADWTAEATLFAETLRAGTGFALPVAAQAPATRGQGNLVFRVDASVSSPEGYRLTSGFGGVEIVASDAAGAFYGAQTLLQMMPAAVVSGEVDQAGDAAWAIPAATIADQPRYGYRGVMLDVARSFLTPEEVKAMIEGMASLKVNTLHLHLADDQAWRIEIKQPSAAENPYGFDYTKLTSVGSEGGADYLYGTTLLGRELAHRGFYTQEEYADLVRYAAERHIDVIPEIDTPGHTAAAMVSIPQLQCQDMGPLEVKRRTGEVGYSYLCPERPETASFLGEVYQQLAALTPGPYLHMGGDEPLSMIDDRGLRGYVEGVNVSVDAVRAADKSVMGWSEWANGDVQSGDIVQYWQVKDAEVTVAAAAKGAKIVMSPSDRTYLDQRYTVLTPPLGLTWACPEGCSVTSAYAWDPAIELEGLPADSVIGVEAALWSETIRGRADAEFLLYPRLLATAEVAWSPQEARSTDEFVSKAEAFVPRLQAAGINAAPWETAAR
ncbi:beta-N-acetylhexosaminidase [Micrococcales bacterium 31B]|nr:beta-N-acetylhexosaminidase [Micrococcales bacterium 31B]